jgi:fibrillarin-like pre-rRNA processing protein
VKERFPGIYEINDSLATRNLVPGDRVYGERLVKEGDAEYRLWNPRRSKLAAALIQGLSAIPIKGDSTVLYLGASTGTTASHVSDLCPRGVVYCVESSSRSMRDLYGLCKRRPNMVPLLADARDPEGYSALLERCDLIYQDIAQREQAAILLENADWFLKEGGEILLAVKAKSIDVTKDPRKIFEKETALLKGSGFQMLDIIPLEPFHRYHILIHARRTF